MKKIALIGASGFVGGRILKELVNRSYYVLAIARNIAEVDLGENVEETPVNVYETNALTKALKGADAVISAFNAGWQNPNLYSDFLKGSLSIEQAVEQAGVKRLIVIGGAGSLYGANDTQLVDEPGFPGAFKPGATAGRDYLNILRKNTLLDWTYISPAIEMNAHTSGVRKGTYRTGLEHPVFNDAGRSIISAEDLAVAVVDELENNQYIRKRFTVAN